MTNWMTAAGIAFIAGGLATLISLRSVLFGGKGRRPAEAEAAVAERPPAAATSARRSKAERRGPRGERERPAEQPPTDRPDLSETAFLDLAPADHPDVPHDHPGIGPDDDAGSLALIGLADEYDEADEAEYEQPRYEAEHQQPQYELAPPDSIVDFPAPPEPVAVTPDDETARPIPVRREDRRYGDRVAGWVRPEYHDDPPQSPSGEYWTPVPMEDLGIDLAEADPEPSARGYGWPIQVERLPAVPDYEPATGFDLTPIASEPTEAVPIWPPDRRVRLPPSWAGRNEQRGDNRFLENEPGAGRRKNHDEADQRFHAPTGEPERRRPRPRPRPAPEPNDAYVSRHAAEPPRRP